MLHAPAPLASDTIISASWVDYLIVAIYFGFVLGIVMMPFYYGSQVRSVPEFMLRRFGTGAHLVNAVSFAVAQLLIAGINLYLLGSIIQALLGLDLFLAVVIAAVIVLCYITLGGLWGSRTASPRPPARGTCRRPPTSSTAGRAPP